jgi:alginate O-acetyltransferase complex protein AlgI
LRILQILVLVGLAAAVGRLRRGRRLVLLAVSASVIFWLQPAQSVASFAYWLPVGTLAVTIMAWAVTSSPETRTWRQTWPAMAVLVTVTVAVGAGRHLGMRWDAALQAPRLRYVFSILPAAGVFILGLHYWRSRERWLLWMAMLMLVGIFVILKAPELTLRIESWLGQTQQEVAAPTSPTPIAWLGFSYVAFRLLHTIRDRQSGRLPSVSLAEYIDYVCFFPAFTAGPIDRLERFVPELRSPLPVRDQDWLYAGERIVVGLFKKFVISDLLAVISISDAVLPYVKNWGWMWIMVYAYSFRIYLDFSGYTDIAIGIGRLLGVQLPENFAAPYLKPNIAQFWNSWHMTLTQWFRAYVFNPLARRLRSAERPWSVWLVVLVAQVTTMVLIGLWHGIAWSFAAWGLWHAVGLFLHNRWASFSSARAPWWMQTTAGHTAGTIVGTFLTFNFVTLGWLFFVLSTPGEAWQALLKLAGAL